MSLRFPRFLGAAADGDPSNVTAGLVAASQVQECRELCSFSFGLAAGAVQGSIPSPKGANKAMRAARHSSGTGTSPGSCLCSVLCCLRELIK